MQEAAKQLKDNTVNQLPEKVSPALGDIIYLEDSALGYIKKKAQVGNLPASAGGTFSHAYAVDTGINGTVVAGAGKAVAFRLVTNFAILATPQGSVFIDVTIPGARTLNVDVTDSTETIVYGTISGIAASGIYSFALAGLPIAGSDNLHIRASRGGGGGASPSINDVTLYIG